MTQDRWGYPEGIAWWDLHKVKIPFTGDVDEIEEWCIANIGPREADWALASNAHNHIFFIPEEHVMMFTLRWGG